jgi:hypothetical protein
VLWLLIQKMELFFKLEPGLAAANSGVGAAITPIRGLGALLKAIQRFFAN